MRFFNCKRILIVLCWGFSLLLGNALSAPLDWEQAEREILHLPPKDIAALPLAIRTQLKERGCTIPQTSFWSAEVHNVVQGEFAAKGQLDWAVLCSRNSQSTITLFWGGPVRCASEFETKADRGFLQAVGNGQFAFSRRIDGRDRASMIQIEKAFGEESFLPPGEHQGLYDSFVEKTSRGWYCSEGKWVSIAGID